MIRHLLAGTMVVVCVACAAARAQTVAPTGRAVATAPTTMAVQPWNQKYDLNGDGVLSEAEIIAMRQEMQAKADELRRQMELQLYDKNKDGKLDAEETAVMEKAKSEQARAAAIWRQRTREYENLFDADGDGKLSEQESAAARAYALAEQERARRDYLKKADTNGDGKASEEERAAYYAATTRQVEEERKKQTAKFDTNGDGQLTGEELAAYQEDQRKTAMERYGKVHAERIARIVAEFDTDGDGRLSRDEKVAMAKKLLADSPAATRTYSPVTRPATAPGASVYWTLPGAAQ